MCNSHSTCAGPDDPTKIKYEAESPDESALVVAAKVMGFFCYKRTNTAIYVREGMPGQHQDVEFEVLNILEFDSTRKRMSTIVRSPEGKIMLFCKVGPHATGFLRLHQRIQQLPWVISEQCRVRTQSFMSVWTTAIRPTCSSKTPHASIWRSLEQPDFVHFVSPMHSLMSKSMMRTPNPLGAPSVFLALKA